MRMTLLMTAAAVAAFAAGSADAKAVLNDNFKTENGGATALNYAGFTNFNTVGNVDLVAQTNPYGISAPHAVVDLDGSSGPGELVTKASYSFHADQVISLTAFVSGSQRSTASDVLFTGVTFSAPTLVRDFTKVGAFPGFGFNGTQSVTSLSAMANVAGTTPYESYTFFFVTRSSGTLTANIGTTSADNVGPVLESLRLDIGGGVPEPASWALLIAGFGAIGVLARRRRVIATA